MSILSDVFEPKFVPVRLGNYLVTNFYDYVAYMKTSSTTQDPYKWGGFLEIVAATIMYRRPIHVHVMDVNPEHVICFDESLLNKDPILLSYEGGNHYNALIRHNHRYLESRPGTRELLTLSSAVLRKVRLFNGMPSRIVSNSELDAVLENKKVTLSNNMGI